MKQGKKKPEGEKMLTLKDGQKMTIVVGDGAPINVTLVISGIGCPMLKIDENNDPRVYIDLPAVGKTKVIHLRP